MAKFNKEDCRRLDCLFRVIDGFEGFEGIDYSVGDFDEVGFINLIFSDNASGKFRKTVYNTIVNNLILSGFEFKGELGEDGINIEIEGIDERDFVNTLYNNYFEE